VHVLIDTSGQGSIWVSGGHTPDPHGSGPGSAGFLTRGILSREIPNYHRRLYTDAVRLVDAVCGLNFVDPDQIAVPGESQGGGIVIAVEAAPGLPITEIARYLATHRADPEPIFATLAHFDRVHLVQ